MLHQSGESPANTPPDRGLDASPPQVLLVDDEVRNLDVLESVLESRDYRLVRALSADEALLALIDGEFAAIVLDVQLPGMNGLELAHLIKQRKRTQDIPIIFLTAYFPEEKFVLEGYHVGAVDYLIKPVKPEILRSKVNVFVDLYRKTRALAAMNRALAVEVGQRRDAEEALRRANVELEDRVQERTADLQRARDDALAASRAKDDFLAALSHELRTPLNPVLLIASDAAENPQLPDGVRADFAAIRKNIETEAVLIDDLLDLTRIARGKLTFDSVLLDAHHVLREAIEAVQPEMVRKSLILELKLGAGRTGIMGDATRLQQVFWNVLNNAAKFTAGKGHIKVTTEELNDRLAVTVTDTGIGMSTFELQRAFEPFCQGARPSEDRAHVSGGLGLGLTIARRLVELHGGQISASSPGRGLGATVVIELPLVAEKPEAVVPNGARQRGSRVVPADHSTKPGTEVRSVRILLVEDHNATRNTLTRLLVRRHHTVAPAATMTEALALASSQSFDLLVSDIGLPDGDGCILMQQLRLRQPNLAGIALSGYGMEEDRARSRTAGFSQHFIKPVDVRALDRAIAELLHPSA